MKVSVILPIYNGEKTLERTLESLVGQTFKDFELVACIDGTEDNSLQILEKWRARFQKVVILKNKTNLGLGPTMNHLFSKSIGAYIAVAEQDDFYYPDRLMSQVEVLDKMSTIGMVSGIAEFWGGNKVSSKFPGLLVNGEQYPEKEQMFLLNYRKQIKVVNSCLMIRKQVHIDNGLYFTQHYPSISVDWTYVLRFSLVSTIFGLPQTLVRIDRSMDRNSVTSNKEKQFKASRELIRSFAYEYPEVISKEDYKFAYRTQLVMENNHKLGLQFVIRSLKNILKYPSDTRFRSNLYNRLVKKLKR